jgi:geranylgeranyl reductase
MLHVVVVGGGPAGLVAAETLAKGGVATTLLERAPEHPRACAGLATSGLLAGLGLDSDRLLQRVEAVGLHAPMGRSAYMTLGAADAVAGAIDRPALIAHLRARAEAAGVTMLHGRFVRFVHGEGDYPRLAYLDAAGATQEIGAEVVIAADGAASAVAHALGLPRLNLAVAYQERFVAASTLPTSAAQLHFGRKVSNDLFGYFYPAGAELVAGVTTELKHGKRVWDTLAELKKRVNAGLDGAKSLKKEAFVYPIAAREALTHDRMLFVGDAAGLGGAATRDGLHFACESGRIAAETILAHQHVPVPERLAEFTTAWKDAYGKVVAQHAKLMTLFFHSERRREALIDLAWDREAARYAVEAYLTKRPFAPPFQAAMRLKAKLATQLLRYNMMSPKRLEGEVVRQMPIGENYLELALKSKSGPLTPVPPPPPAGQDAPSSQEP